MTFGAAARACAGARVQMAIGWLRSALMKARLPSGGVSCSFWAVLCAALLWPIAARSQDAAPPAHPPATAPPSPAGTADLPVSLDHIREGLKKAPPQSLLRDVDIPADFRVQIQEQQRI